MIHTVVKDEVRTLCDISQTCGYSSAKALLFWTRST